MTALFTAPAPARGARGQVTPDGLPARVTGSHGQHTPEPAPFGTTATNPPAREPARAGAGQADRPTCPRPRHPEGGAGAEGSRRAPGLNANRKALRTQCPTCGSEVLAGLDADAMASEVVIDPAPIGLGREVTELEHGRPTYTYDRITRRIDYRDRGSLSNPLRLPVHPTHTCQETSW